MAKILPAKRVRNMIEGLEELKMEYRYSSPSFVVEDIKKAIQALERLWKSFVA